MKENEINAHYISTKGLMLKKKRSCYELNMNKTGILRIEQIKLRDIRTVKADALRTFFQKHQKHPMLTILDFKSIRNIRRVRGYMSNIYKNSKSLMNFVFNSINQFRF